MVAGKLSGIGRVWREIARGTASTLGLKSSRRTKGSPEALKEQMRLCLEARGGEISARYRAAELAETYLALDAEGQQAFLVTLARSFAVASDDLDAAVAGYQAADGEGARLDAERALRAALVPPRLKLLTQFNAFPQGAKFLVDLRAGLLAMTSDDPALKALDHDLQGLLASWFDVGFLNLQPITWRSGADLLEKLIAYEAVHEIRSWADLRNRLDSDRRCYALFHPRMPDEPLAFVEIALCKGMASSIQALLDEAAPGDDPAEADTAIFYSITNTQKGLQGISFGEFLIKRVADSLLRELPRLKTFATLSPIPGFRRWLDGVDAPVLAAAFEGKALKALSAEQDPEVAAAALRGRLDEDGWADDKAALELLKGPLKRLAARYLCSARADGLPLDPVARFHLKNGARLERLNWLGDRSPRGFKQSAGMMVNYLYDQSESARNHEAYSRGGRIVASGDIKALVRAAKPGDAVLKRLGNG